MLSVLVNLKASAESFTAELQQNLAGVDTTELQQIAAVVYAPFEPQVSRSGTVQHALLKTPSLALFKLRVVSVKYNLLES